MAGLGELLPAWPKYMTQQEIVIQKLLDDGEVSRNWCLNLRITRLGAIVCDLNHQGWIIDGMWKLYDGGKDYVYLLRHAPEKLVFKKELKQETLNLNLQPILY